MRLIQFESIQNTCSNQLDADRHQRLLRWLVGRAPNS